MDGVVGDHGLHTVEARPRVAVGKQEIFGAGGDGHPQAAALLEAFGEFCGADVDLSLIHISKGIILLVLFLRPISCIDTGFSTPKYPRGQIDCYEIERWFRGIEI